MNAPASFHEPAQGSEDPWHLLDLLPGMLGYSDVDMIVRYANRRYCEWRGLRYEQIVGRPWREVMRQENYPGFAVLLKRALGGEAVSTEIDLFEGARARRIQFAAVPDRDRDGTIVGVLMTVTELSDRVDLRAHIAEVEGMFDDAFQAAPIGMAIVDVDGRVLRVNAALAAMLDRSSEALSGMHFRDLTHPDDIEGDLGMFGAVLAGKRNGYQIEKRYLKPDGSIVWTMLSVSCVRDANGLPLRFVAQVEDITQRRDAERRLVDANARLSLAMDTVVGGFWHMDLASRAFEASSRLAEFIFGDSKAAIDLERYRARIHLDDRAQWDPAPLARGDLRGSRVEYRMRTHQGWRWLRCDRRLQRGADGEPEQIVAVCIDVTLEREQQQRIETEAATDPLTGLLNRRGLERRAALLDCPAGLLAIDLNGFKSVNDRFGHLAGDRVLIETAQRLAQIVRPGDLVARLGGDEFLIILADGDPARVAIAAERARTALQSPFQVDGTTLTLGGGVGTARMVTGTTLHDALMQADLALYADKAERKRAG